MNMPVTLTPGEFERSEPVGGPASAASGQMPLSRHLLAWLAVLLAAAAIVGGLGYYKYAEIGAAIAAASTMPEPSAHIEAVRVQRGTWKDTASAVGTVVSLRQVELRSELAGTVAEVGFRSGDIVAEDQVLVRLDTREQEAALAAARAEAQLARATFKRRDALREGQTVSEQAVDDARAQLAIAEAHVRALEVGIAKKTIRAPFRGQVGLTDLQPGAYLDAGSTITTLQDVGQDAYVDFSLPQGTASAIHTGQTVMLAGPQFPDDGMPATIVATDAAVDGESRAVTFRALARGLGETLRPGSFVDVTAVSAPPQDVLLAPLTAVRRAPFGAYVYLLAEEDGVLRARQRIVETGPVAGKGIVVRGGLAAGDVIAGAGSFKLREGLLVQVGSPGGVALGAAATN